MDGAVHRRGLRAGISINAASGGVGEILVRCRCNMVQLPKRSLNVFLDFSTCILLHFHLICVSTMATRFTQVLKAFMPLESVRVLDLCSAPGSKVLGREASIGTVEFVFMISYDMGNSASRERVTLQEA